MVQALNAGRRSPYEKEVVIVAIVRSSPEHHRDITGTSSSVTAITPQSLRNHFTYLTEQHL
jgi:hypothetical protein